MEILYSSFCLFYLSVENDDCGCGSTVISGKASDMAKNEINHCQALSIIPLLYSLQGTNTTIDDIIGPADGIPRQILLVVFLRSLGPGADCTVSSDKTI